MRILLIITGLLISSAVMAQRLNVQAYTPSVLLQPGQWEAKHYNNLYTQTVAFDAEGMRETLGQRGTWFASINSVMTGVSDRWNVGGEVWVRSVRIGEPTESAFNLFRFQNNNMARTGVAYAGPKVKWLPFAKQKRISLQSTFLIPVAANLQGDMRNQPWLDRDRYLWVTQLLWDHQLASKWQVFIDAAVWASFDREGDAQGHLVESPVKGFLSYFPNSRLTFFAMTEYWPIYGTEQLLSGYFVQAGVGGKVQIIPGLLEGEMQTTQFVAGRQQGAGRTLNAGLRFLW